MLETFHIGIRLVMESGLKVEDHVADMLLVAFAIFGRYDVAGTLGLVVDVTRHAELPLANVLLRRRLTCHGNGVVYHPALETSETHFFFAAEKTLRYLL